MENLEFVLLVYIIGICLFVMFYYLLCFICYLFPNSDHPNAVCLDCIWLIQKCLSNFWLYEWFLSGILTKHFWVRFMEEDWVLQGKKRSWGNCNCSWGSKRGGGGAVGHWKPPLASRFLHYEGLFLLPNLFPYPMKVLVPPIVTWNGALKFKKSH